MAEFFDENLESFGTIPVTASGIEWSGTGSLTIGTYGVTFSCTGEGPSWVATFTCPSGTDLGIIDVISCDPFYAQIAPDPVNCADNIIAVVTEGPASLTEWLAGSKVWSPRARFMASNMWGVAGAMHPNDFPLTKEQASLRLSDIPQALPLNPSKVAAYQAISP